MVSWWPCIRPHRSDALIAACGLGDKRMSRTLRRIAEHQNVGDLPDLEFEDDD